MAAVVQITSRAAKAGEGCMGSVDAGMRKEWLLFAASKTNRMMRWQASSHWGSGDNKPCGFCFLVFFLQHSFFHEWSSSNA